MMEEQFARTQKRRDNVQARQNSGNPPKRPHLLKYDVSHLVPPTPLTSKADSTVNQVLNEANKIVQLNVQRDILLYDQERVIKDSNETIESLRRNLIQMQMEYERLDQNYQREISYRSELSKRIDTTRDMVESAGKYSNILAESVQLVTNDRDTIVEYYNGIMKKQAEVEEKHKQAESMLKDQEEMIQKFIKRVSENSQKEVLEVKQTVAQLNNKLKSEMEQNEHLAAEIKQLKQSNESLSSLLSKANASKKEKEDHKYLKIKAAYKNLQSQKIQKERQWKIYKTKARQQIKDLQENILKNEKFYNEAISSNENLEKEFVAVKKEFELLQQAKAELLKQIEEDEKVIENRGLENQNLQEKINELMAEFEALKLDSTKNLTELQEKYLCIVKEKEELEEFVSGFKLEKNTEIEKLNEKINELERDIRIFEDKEKELKNEIHLSEENIKKERLENFETISTYVKNIENMKVEIDELKNKENNLEAFLNEKCEELRKIKEELNDKEIVVENLKRELQDASDTKKSVDDLNSEIKNYQENINAYKADLKELQREIHEMKMKLEMETAKNKSLQLEKEKFENMSITLREDLENEKQSSDKIKSDLSNIKYELYEAKKKIEDDGKKNAAVAHLKKSLEQSQADAEALKRIVKKLETDKQKEINDLKEELKQLKDAKEKREESLEIEIESIRKDLRSQLDKKILEIEQLQDENEKLNQKIASLKLTETAPECTDFPKPSVIPERRTTALTFSSTSTLAPKKFLTTPRKLFNAPVSARGNSSTSRKDIYDFDSDSSVERYEPQAIRKHFKQTQKKEPSSKGKKQ